MVQNKLLRICAKCGTDIPKYAKVNGVKKRLHRQYCLDCNPWGAPYKRQWSKYSIINGIEHRRCPSCRLFKPMTNEFYTLNDNGQPKHVCKKCNTLRSKRKSKKYKRLAIEYKGGKCEDCSGTFLPDIYDFHHLDPTQKDFNISLRRNAKFDEKIKTELDKCALLCANCHRTRHAIENKFD